MSFIKLTDHAKSRSYQRYRLHEDQLIGLAEKAVTEGYSYNDAPNKEIAKYLKKKAREKKAYVYSGYVFILTKNLVLVTTYRLPRRYLLSIA